MRANVLNDSALLKRAGQFAWLSVDVDKPENQILTTKAGGEGVPMFLVIDPKSENVLLRWYGSATAPQISRLLDDAGHAVQGNASGAEAILNEADRLEATKKYAEAAAAFRRAMDAGGPAWPGRARAIESLVMALGWAGRKQECAQTAIAEAPRMPRDRSVVNVIYFGLGCSKPGTPESAELESLAEDAVTIEGVLGDDTAQLYGDLAYRYRDEKKEEQAVKTMQRMLEFVQAEQKRAKTPEGRAAYDSYLVTAARFLNKPEVALKPLQRSERDFPNDYNPPIRLAAVYVQMGRYDDAVAAAQRAIDRAYGPRKVSAYTTKAAALNRMGRRDDALKAYDEAIAFARTLPNKNRDSIIASIERTRAQVAK